MSGMEGLVCVFNWHEADWVKCRNLLVFFVSLNMLLIFRRFFSSSFAAPTVSSSVVSRKLLCGSFQIKI